MKVILRGCLAIIEYALGTGAAPAAARRRLLLGLLLGAWARPAAAQVNNFVARPDQNQVARGTSKSGSVLPNDDNPDNIPNTGFVVTLVTGPGQGTLVSFAADGSYTYAPNAGYTGPDSFTYQICQPGATPTCSNVATVRLNVYDPNQVCVLGTGRNLLTNPSFTAGNAGFVSSYVFVATPTSPPTLYQEGTYAVDSDANAYHTGFAGTGRTGSGDKFMIVNGAPQRVAVYSQTVTVLPNRYYLFSAYGVSTNPVSPAQLGLVVNNESTSSVTTLPTTVGNYIQFSDLFFSGPGSPTGFPVTVEIRDVNKDLGGNDFGLDDLYFGACSTALLADTKTTAPAVPAGPLPAPILPLSATLSAGGSVGVTVASFTVQTLPATGTLRYNGAPVTVGQVIPVGAPGSLSSGGALTYTPAAGSCAASSATFTYTATDSEGTGSGNIATYTIPVVPLPAPTVRVPSALPVCAGDPVRLVAAGLPAGYRYTWLDGGGAVLNAPGAVLDDSVLVVTAAGSYSVRIAAGSCTATSAPVAVTTKTCGPPEPCSLNEKFINTWYFGQRAGLDFNAATDSIPPVVLTNGQMVAPGGPATMSDANGALLFYSNGVQVWNRNHVPMPNGSGLGPAVNATVNDGPVAVRRPGSTTQYYLFTQDAAGAGGVYYSLIDMSLNGGLGDVVTGQKRVPLARRTTEKMTAVLHANGCDVWVLVHGWGDPALGNEPGWPAAEHRGDAFLAFRVTPTGVVTTPVVSTVGPLHAPSVAPRAYKGQIKVSPNGQRLAVARYNDGPVPANGTVELYDFSDATGTVSNPRAVATGEGGYYGVEFSPGLSLLYVTVQRATAAADSARLLQFNLDSTNIAATRKVIAASATDTLGSIQAAPDGKLYVSRRNLPALGVVNRPDSVGRFCRYRPAGQPLGGRLSGLGLPNFVQSFLVKVGFGYRSTACQVIAFEAGTSIPNPETYAWDFGEPGSGAANTASIEKPSHSYAAPGVYTITLTITKSCLCKTIKSSILVPGSPTAGSIGADQSLCAGATPAPLTSTAGAGAGTGQYAYQWEASPDNTTWTALAGANGPTLAPGPLSQTTYFRRRVSSGFCAPAVTGSVALRVRPALVAGSIGADQLLCPGAAPAALTSTAGASGGTGTYAYQWQLSPDGTTFTDIGGATGPDYQPGTLAGVTYFRRAVVSGSGSCATATSNTVRVTPLPALAAGGIGADQTLCAGATPAPLTGGTPPSGGTGTFAFQWEASADNATWTAISGATGPDYAPGPLTATTYFRRRVAAGPASCPAATSNVVTLKVLPAVAGGSIGADQTLCAGAAPAALTSATGATGGDGSYAYQWQSSPDNATWTDLAGATGTTYAPPVPAATTYFRRLVTSGGGCGAAASNSVVLNVAPALTAGSLGADQTICAGSTPAPLGGAAPTGGGSGNYAFQWESSPDNATWTAIAGATGAGYAPGPLAATTYFRRGVSAAGGPCPPATTGPVAVRVLPVLTPSISLPAPAAQCAGTTLNFSPVATNAGASPSYRWLVNGAVVATTPTFSSSTLANGDQVRVELTPTPGPCTGSPVSATVAVTITPTLAPALGIGVQPAGVVCPGTPLTFSLGPVSNPGAAPQYQWQVDGADVPGATGPTFSSSSLRDGQLVTLGLRTTNNCGQPAAATSNAQRVSLVPPVVVSAGPDKEVVEGESVVLEGSTNGAQPVEWTPAATLSFPAGGNPLRPVAAPTSTTVYTLTAGPAACSGSSSVTVRVLPPIRIPNVFSPNADGQDDTWEIDRIGNFPGNVVTVFNRWGNQVFTTSGYRRGNEWGGQINGQPAPVGTYYYVITLGNGRSFAGAVTVVY